MIRKTLVDSSEGSNLVEKLTNYFTNNSTHFLYKLLAEEEESIVLPKIDLQEGTNIIDIQTEVPATHEITYIIPGNDLYIPRVENETLMYASGTATVQGTEVIL